MSAAIATESLRDRKKAQRRDALIAAATTLFGEKGVDATTLADIAEACDVSVPTVFNYFGSKDGLLMAIIDEGARKGRDEETRLPRPEGVSLASVIQALFSRISSQTLAIAPKRVWRYAEASVIRHPDTELSNKYRRIETLLVDSIAALLDAYALKTRSGAPLDPHDLATMLHDLWMPCFICLITDAEMTIAQHDALVARRVLPMLALIFDDESLTSPRLRNAGTPDER
ncbi:TetR/AcrR family transcriptional regulator [Rhodobacter sp. NTK016B]|uniref:TetR/AcrR family transcriptional regulator n=1 Tax=Rhodobacter sp. NTK016B TaxID=2759676 RepID=UPI001A8C1ED9|nr:TetR/AcrR family transcriptional regulator [Rhodobacter sp. NTK016B]MBN8293311.1 TetR/AcrR family transcriptional regulator [Rhodobacter sp. NTK016B]